MAKLIVYTCPKCGKDLQEICLASMPPQYKMQCLSCGWSYTKPQEPLGIVRLTFEPEKTNE